MDNVLCANKASKLLSAAVLGVEAYIVELVIGQSPIVLLRNHVQIKKGAINLAPFKLVLL